MLSASKNAPAVLLLAGSGPTDRDGNSGAGLHGDTYKLLAEGLAAKGITSLRVDKRGIGESRVAETQESDLRFTSYTDDAAAWAADLPSPDRTKMRLAGRAQRRRIGGGSRGPKSPTAFAA